MSDKNRLEAFSDGVLAIAITLLVLDLRVPVSAAGGRSLARALLDQWPAYAAYVVSFLVIGIIWVNHHGLFGLISKVDRWVLFANLLLLMVVAAIPFPTELMAEYLTAGGASARTAALVYSGTMLAMSIAFVGLFLAATRNQDMLAPGLQVAVVRQRLPRFGLGVVMYAATMVVALVSAPLTLLVHFALGMYYVFDQLGSGRG
jgi:uncharacterized membrane protein